MSKRTFSTFTYRRVIALAENGQKLSGFTVPTSEDANAILSNGVFLFGEVFRTRNGYVVKQTRTIHKFNKNIELCFFPPQ